MFKRIKKLWKLAGKDEKALELLTELTPEQHLAIPEANEGDGKAVFFDEGFEDEAKELEKEDAGLKPWYERILNL